MGGKTWALTCRTVTTIPDALLDSWYGVFVPTGEKLPRVDAMAYAWSGEWPENRAPKIRSLVA